MRYVEKIVGGDTIKVSLPADEAARFNGGNRILAELQARARLAVPDRVFADTYTSDVSAETGAYTATFALVPE